MSIQVSSQGINYIPTRAQQQSLNAPLQPKVASNLFPIAPIRITAKKSIPQMLLKAIYQNDPQFGEYFNAHPILFNLLDTAVSKQDKSKILAQFLETTMIDQPTVNKLYSIVNDIKWGPVIGSKFLFDGESSNTLDNVNDVLGRDVYSDLAHKGLFVKDPKELINRTLSREDVLKLMNRGLTQAQVTNLFINSLPHTNPEIIRQTVGQIFTEEQPVQEVPVEGLGGPETLVPGGQPVPLNPLGPVSPQTTSVENPPQGPVVASAPDSTMVPNKILESLTNAISSLSSRMASLETPVPPTVTGPFGEDFSKELDTIPDTVVPVKTEDTEQKGVTGGPIVALPQGLTRDQALPKESTATPAVTPLDGVENMVFNEKEFDNLIRSIQDVKQSDYDKVVSELIDNISKNKSVDVIENTIDQVIQNQSDFGSTPQDRFIYFSTLLSLSQALQDSYGDDLPNIPIFDRLSEVIGNLDKELKANHDIYNLAEQKFPSLLKDFIKTKQVETEAKVLAPEPTSKAPVDEKPISNKEKRKRRQRVARGEGLSNVVLRPIEKFIKDARFKVTKRDSVNQEDLDQRQSKVQTKSAKELLSDLASYTDFPTNVVRRNFGRHFSIKNMPKLLENYVRDNGDDMKQFNEDLKELRRYLSDNTK